MRSLIIGCGYLGGALARYWREKGYFVIGTTTRQERLAEVAPLATEAVLLNISDEEQLRQLLAQVQVVVVLVAAAGPQLEDYKRAYLETAHAISRALIYAPSLRQVVYTSSTAVYGDHEGRGADEKTPLEPLTEQAEVLRETEEVYLHGFEACTSTILRLGELNGPGRSMKARVTRLCGAVLAGSGSAPVNLTHQEDAVRAIDWVIERRLGGVYNVVERSSSHSQGVVSPNL
ncbi:MAG: NAD-dependent epimerase/dehydratase family protein [Verrucomicrobia bacterium]|nr:NAD-dependent epimerase/dehydratase family protein [Verrucomicrobiota bacterium]